MCNMCISTCNSGIQFCPQLIMSSKIIYAVRNYIHNIILSKKNLLTFIGTQGYSGKAFATAFAPASLVHCDKPTKNSFPEKKNHRYLVAL